MTLCLLGEPAPFVRVLPAIETKPGATITTVEDCKAVRANAVDGANCFAISRSINSRILLMQYVIGRTLFRIFVRDEMIAAASTIHDITEVARSFGPDIYQVDEVIDSDRVENRRGSRFWEWVTHDRDGIISIEPCLSVLEG
jgi:hypothetical protein